MRVSPSIKRYAYPNGTPYWRVTATLPGGILYQKKHREELAAERDATRLVAVHATGGADPLEWLRYQEAVLAMKSSDNADARDVPLADLVRWACERYVNPRKVRKVAEYVEDLVNLKHDQGRRPDTIRELDAYFSVVVRELGHIAVTDFDQAILDDFVARHARGRKSLRRWRAHLKHFFDYLIGTSKMSPNPTPILRRSPIVAWPARQEDRDSTEQIVALTAAELEGLLKAAAAVNAQRMFLWLAFTGMRPFESVRFWTDPELGWKAVNLARNVINVPARIAKTRKPRKIKIRPVLQAWLEHYRSFPSFLTRNWRDKYCEVRTGLPEERRADDICRHTFITMLIESGEPWAKIELEVGNTKEIQLEHYAQLVENPADAQAFWSMTPDKIGVFDATESEWQSRARANRTRAVLENRKKVRTRRNGCPLAEAVA